jgi:sugar O-acyltransferase (sialic acid O-acetyltransferase NeuD family)
MIEYAILGCSRATLSMLLETIHRLHPQGARVEVVLNVPVEAGPPVAVDGVEVVELPHDRWDHRQAARRGARLLVGVYRPSVKRAVVEFFARQLGLAETDYSTLVHPAAEAASTTELGGGVSLGPGAVTGPYARLGGFVTVNRAASVGHHAVLEDFVTVNPGAHVAGRCRLGEGVAVGMGAVVLDGVRVGAGSLIGAGSVVTRDLPEGIVAFGAPARVVREAG